MINVKKISTIALLAAIGLSACNNNKAQENTSSASKEQSAKGEKSSAANARIVRKHLSVPTEFSNIINIGDVDIIYSFGECAMEVEGDSDLIKFLDTSYEGNLLTVGIRGDANQNVNHFGATENVKVYISSPKMECVSVCGKGNFTMNGKWVTEKAQVGVLGDGGVKFGNIECNIFLLEATGKGDVTIDSLKATEATISSRNKGNFKVNVDVENLYVMNQSASSFVLTGRAGAKFISNPKAGHLTDKVMCP